MKKTICLMLVLLMVLSVFTACGGTAKPAEDAAEATAGTEAPTVPEKVELSAPELAALASKATVTVHTDQGTGTGFFIDNEGTLITCFHVIDGANEIRVGMNDGGSYDVVKIIDFSELYDIAVLKASISNTPYLEISKAEIVQGEDAYAIGASNGLDGTFSNGVISATSRKIGIIDCVQTTAATSGGNSGGPLLNVYGEVIGINAYGYKSGQNLNLAIAVEMLDQLSMDKNWSISQFREWTTKELSRSFMVRTFNTLEDEYVFYRTYIHTYQHVTGRACYGSDIDWDILKNNTRTMVYEYRETAGVYVYEYDVKEFDQYTEYLTNIGFAYEDSVNFEGGIMYEYYNDYTGYTMLIAIMDTKGYIVIEPCY